MLQSDPLCLSNPYFKNALISWHHYRVKPHARGVGGWGELPSALMGCWFLKEAVAHLSLERAVFSHSRKLVLSRTLKSHDPLHSWLLAGSFSRPALPTFFQKLLFA